MPVRVRSSEGLGVTDELCADGQLAAGQSIGSQATSMNPLLDDFGWSQSRRRQRITKPEARLAKFYATESKATHCEGLAYKFVQPHSAGDEVSPTGRQSDSSLVPDGESFDLLCFNERDVLTRLILGVEVAVAADAGACRNLYPLLFDLLLAIGRTDEDAFNHLV
jgi:hypothetical protein